MCSPLNPLTCPTVIETVADAATDVAHSAGDGVVTVLLAALDEQMQAGVRALTLVLAGWLLVPSTQVCPGGGPSVADWAASCATSPAAQLRSWTLPVTILVAVLGMLWQAILLTVTRKGEPLLAAVRGLATTALWGAVGIVGTQLALKASDGYSFWILQQAVFGDSTDPVDTLGTALSGMSPAESYNTLILLLLFHLPILVATVTQIILMIFREGAVVILAGLVQLAAAGSFTRLTSGWLPKVTGWMLALVCYKPLAATVYATAFALMGADGTRNSITGLAVMILAIVAMPAAMRFFNWTVGSFATSASTLGMLGTAAAAGVHAASSLRGIGGYHVGDHATYMDQYGPGSARPGRNSTSGGGGGGGPGDGGGPAPARIIPPTPTGGGARHGPGAARASFAGPATTAAGGAYATSGASAAAAAGTAGATVAADAARQAKDRASQAVQQAADATGDATHGK